MRPRAAAWFSAATCKEEITAVDRFSAAPNEAREVVMVLIAESSEVIAASASEPVEPLTCIETLPTANTEARKSTVETVIWSLLVVPAPTWKVKVAAAELSKLTLLNLIA